MTDAAEAAVRFGEVAERYCVLVDGSSTIDRSAFIVRVYCTLPELISEAVKLPGFELGEESVTRDVSEVINHQAWRNLYERLQEKLGDWDIYQLVFNPLRDTESISGRLADDIADIYRDLKRGLTLAKQGQPEEAVWEWRGLFRSHSGQHAIDTLRTIHFLIEEHGLQGSTAFS